MEVIKIHEDTDSDSLASVASGPTRAYCSCQSQTCRTRDAYRILHAIMSSRSIEPTLNNLLPTLNDNLPSELVDLAVSLLAQSRTRVSSLKAEEEIARPYICADIACKRSAR